MKTLKTIHDKINFYFDLQKQIYDSVGYEEDWVVLPLEDRREMWWKIEGSESNGTVEFYKRKNPNDLDSEKLEYSDEIYTQRFLSKWVYRSKDITLICVDTHTDGNKFLAIFDSKKEL
jgi:hypothetical protein